MLAAIEADRNCNAHGILCYVKGFLSVQPEKDIELIEAIETIIGNQYCDLAIAATIAEAKN